MPTLTLYEARKTLKNKPIRKIMKDLGSTNRLYSILGFYDIEGNAICFQRERPDGKFISTMCSLTTLIADVDIELEQFLHPSKSKTESQLITEKAESIGNYYMSELVNGPLYDIDTQYNIIPGLNVLVYPEQQVYPQTTESIPLTLDMIKDRVSDKGKGVIDYYIMPKEAFLKFMNDSDSRIRENVEIPDGQEVPAYKGTPLILNESIAVEKGHTSIYGGTLDDGSRSCGISGIVAHDNFGLSIMRVGKKVFRLKWYCALANWSAKGLAVARNVKV